MTARTHPLPWGHRSHRNPSCCHRRPRRPRPHRPHRCRARSIEGTQCLLSAYRLLGRAKRGLRKKKKTRGRIRRISSRARTRREGPSLWGGVYKGTFPCHIGMTHGSILRTAEVSAECNLHQYVALLAKSAPVLRAVFITQARGEKKKTPTHTAGACCCRCSWRPSPATARGPRSHPSRYPLCASCSSGFPL